MIQSNKILEGEMKETYEVDIYRVFLPILFIGFAIILELVNFLYLGFTNSEGNVMALPTYFLFDLGIILIIAGFIYLVTNKIAMNVLFYFFLGFQFFMNIVNSTMYKVFGDILSFDLLKLGAEATTAITADFIDWIGVLINVLVFGVMVAVTIVFQKKAKKKISYNKMSIPSIFLVVFMLFQVTGFGVFGIETNSLQVAASEATEIETSDVYLWENFQFKLDAYKKFGHYGFYTKSVLNLIFKEEAEDMQEYVDFIDEGYVAKDENADLYGDNLIVILCESLDWYAIDPYNTPTLWRLSNGDDTIVFNEFYARNRTNHSENITLLDGVSKNHLVGTAVDSGYNFQYSLPNLFKSASEYENVSTSYFHANYGSFYNRDYTHGTNGIGFDNLYFIDDYTGEQSFGGFGEWINDSDFVSNLIDEFLPTDHQFLTYFTTVSTHGSYDYDQANLEEFYQIFDSNYEEFSTWFTENTNYILPENESDLGQLRRYKSAMIDFDRMVETLINEIDARGLTDNTSILLFADHNSYYSNLCYKIKGVEKSDYSNTYINNIPMMLYSPKLYDLYDGEFSKIENTFCSTYDILPTICDLYGLPSNSNLFQGNSVFSDDIENSVFVSNLSGMFTNNIFSFNISDVYIVGENVTEEEISKFKANANLYWKKQKCIEVIWTEGINGSLVF